MNTIATDTTAAALPPVRSEPLLAWLVEIHAMTCIVFAATKAKAKWLAVKAYWDAYSRDGWPRPTASRAERYDDSALRFREPRAWTEDFVRDYPKANSPITVKDANHG